LFVSSLCLILALLFDSSLCLIPAMHLRISLDLTAPHLQIGGIEPREERVAYGHSHIAKCDYCRDAGVDVVCGDATLNLAAQLGSIMEPPTIIVIINKVLELATVCSFFSEQLNVIGKAVE
jgi:hypothetical protein